MNTTLLPPGRLVFFTFLLASLLVAQAGNLQPVSTRGSSVPASVSGGGLSTTPVMSADGRYVAFASTAQNLVPPGNSTASGPYVQRFNVYLRDRVAGTTALVSVNTNGTGGGNADSFPAAVSTNGQFVLFESDAGNLVPGDTNTYPDVFVRDVLNGTTTLVSVNTNGISGNRASYNPVMTPDGHTVAFVSVAWDLIAVDTNNIADIFVRDLNANVTTLVTVGAMSRIALANAAYNSYITDAPIITPDGRYVAYVSTATNLIPGYVSTNSEVYVRDLATATTLWASTNVQNVGFLYNGGPQTNALCQNHAISADGRYVAFEAETISNLTIRARGVVLRQDLQTGAFDFIYGQTNLSWGSFKTQHSLDMTPDGRFVVFVGSTNGAPPNGLVPRILLWDAQAATSTLINGNSNNAVAAGSTASWPSLNSTGQYVAFVSTASDLATNALVTGTNLPALDFRLYIRDVQAATTRLVSLSTNLQGAVISPIYAPSHLSDDGSTIAFESDEPSFVTNDLNRSPDIFAGNLAGGPAELISVRDASLASQAGDGYSKLGFACMSTNGRYVTFITTAPLSRQDTNGDMDVYVRDLLLGTNQLVSAITTNYFAPGTNFYSGRGPSWETSISGDGQFVAFSSWATNLISNDTDGVRDVFLHNMVTHQTALASVPFTVLFGGVPNGESYSPTLSTDARYMLFKSRAANMSGGAFTPGVENLYLRDLLAGTNFALTGPGTTSGPAATMTPDGRYVAYVGMTGLNVGKTYVWNTAKAAPVYTNGIIASNLAITLNGQRIAYVSTNALYVLDWPANSNRLARAGFFSLRYAPRFSADGRFLAYAAATNNSQQGMNVYVYDYKTDTNRLVSKGALFNPGPTPADTPDISANGRYVAYRSSVSNAIYGVSNTVFGDLNAASDIVLYDRLKDVTFLVSINQGTNSTGNHRSSLPVFSGDGQTLVFQSWASDLVAGDFNNLPDIYALQLPTNDSDGDGMDDQWEQDYFGTLARDGTGDFDGDGATDLYEFQTGTDPTDPASVFRMQISLPAAPGGGANITWPLGVRPSYQVQYKDDLTSNTWQNLPGGFNAVGNQCSVTNAPAGGQRYYRILLNN